VRPVFTAAEMRALDARAIATLGIPGRRLMEAAGTGAARVLARRWGPMRRRDVVILCGKGNNGGDGYVVARLLREAGRDVRVLAIAPVDELEGDARTNAERLPGVQDTASQFVQMTYLFRSGARRLVAGGQIELPLALPKRVDRWIYDVVGEETLATPFGPVPAWHLKPRRIGDPSTLAVEAWFAPRLDYLPVRLLIRQSDENFIDLVIDRLPQQAAAPAAGAAASR